jgi:hypothetical protein
MVPSLIQTGRSPVCPVSSLKYASFLSRTTSSKFFMLSSTYEEMEYQHQKPITKKQTGRDINY